MYLHSKGVIYFLATVIVSVTTGRAFAADSMKVCVQVIQKDVRPKPEESSIEKVSSSSDTLQKETKAPASQPSIGSSKQKNGENEQDTGRGETDTAGDSPSMGPPNPSQATDSEIPPDGAAKTPVSPSTASGFVSPAATAQSSPVLNQTERDDENWDRVIRDRRKSLVYIKRLIEYYVTHEPKFEAASEGCQETITVELYPITEGWTAFARFTKNGREERVDNLTQDEISQFAERVVLALLHDVPISETIARDTVLKSDSKKAKQKIRGNSHFTMAVGTQIRGGYMDTAITDRSNPNVGGVEKRVRVAAPMKLAMAYRGRFETWGIENRLNMLIGTEKKAPGKNPLGGHADFSVGTGLSLHVFRYAAPRGLTSFYYGAGGTFELLWFSAINAAGASESRSRLLSGGLDVDGVLGVEFMRASSVQFYIQGELNLPAYMVSRENTYTVIHTWFPGATIELGIMF